MKYCTHQELLIKVKEVVNNYNKTVLRTADFFTEINCYNKNSYDNIELIIKSMNSSFSLLCGIIEGVNMCVQDYSFQLKKEFEIILDNDNKKINTKVYTYELNVVSK